MFTYRVTKYDPSRRDVSGAFLSEDWTSVSDIGRPIGGKTITKQQYFATEDNYVEAVKRFLSAAGISSMRIQNLEIKTEGKDTRLYDNDLAKKCSKLGDNTLVSGRDLEDVVRGCLREYIWCRLAGAHESYLHFGYDYYMYIGLPEFASAVTVPEGIFVEDVDSPYLTIDD